MGEPPDNPFINAKRDAKRAAKREKRREWRAEQRRRSAYLTAQERVKEQARKLVAAALRSGRLVRRPCVQCRAQPAEAHHPDYREPLEVVWLCKRCHDAFTSAALRHAYLLRAWREAKERIQATTEALQGAAGVVLVGAPGRPSKMRPGDPL